jgi:CRISPR system Cascade subunit CasD
MRVLALHLEAPLVAFGDVMIDSLGRIRDVPGQSAITGLLANALGFDRTETLALTRLQERLRFACRIETRGPRVTDMQTAQLGKMDRWWTTTGGASVRNGGASTYDSPHIRWRDYDTDCRMVAVCSLSSLDGDPDIEDIAKAVQRPARPIFLGRKPCLPTRPLFGGVFEATSLMDALRQIPWSGSLVARSVPNELFVRLPADEPTRRPLPRVSHSDHRDWRAGPHTGRYDAQQGYLPTSECARLD